MDSKNNEQNSVIFSIAEILGKMSNQVGFLIRNNKLMSQLDVDMLMENTRKLYDTVCSVRCNMDVDSIPMEVDGDEGTGAGTGDEEQMDVVWDFTDDDDDEDDDAFEDDLDVETDSVNDIDAQDEEVEEEEDIEEEVEEESSESDCGAKTQTIGDILENAEDNSLAARLQKKPIADLTTAVGINDKFLLLNELFSGSMEKYNKSIRALNNFPTLLGAKTYMSELQIEFQWDCESEAYKKLTDLIERRFI